jgi:hypothetical protein
MLEENIVMAMMATKCPQQPQLFNSLPTPDFKLSDAAFLAMAWTRLSYLPECVKTACAIEPGSSRMRHFVTCTTCRQGTRRHNTVLYAFCNTMPKIGIAVTANPHDFPMPKDPTKVHLTQTSDWAEHSTDGPDVQVHTDGHCIDLTITSPLKDWALGEKGTIQTRDCLNRAEQVKNSFYKEWKQAYELTLVPFAMTTTGILSRTILDQLTVYGTGRASWYSNWAVLKMQKALCEAHALIYKSALHRSIGLKFLAPKVQRPTGAASQTPAPFAVSSTPSASQTHHTTSASAAA